MQASIGGKTLDTSKIEKPKFNLFNFQKQAPTATIGGVGVNPQKAPVKATIGGKTMPTITQKQPIQRATIGGVGITPQIQQPIKQQTQQQDIIKAFYDNPNIPDEDKRLVSQAIEQGMNRADAEKYLTTEYSKKDLIIPQQASQPIQGLDVGVKTGQAISSFGKGLKPFTERTEIQGVGNTTGQLKMAGKMLANLPGDTVEFIGGLVGLASNPAQLKEVPNLAGAVVEKTLNKVTGNNVYTTEERRLISDEISKGLQKVSDDPKIIADMIQNNPADVMMTINGALTTAKNVAKAKGMTELASKLETYQSATNPFVVQGQALKVGGNVLKGGVKGVGKGTTELLGKTTGTSGETIRQAFKQGATPEFQKALRGETTAEDILGNVKGALEDIRTNKNKLYGEGAKILQQNKNKLDISDVRNDVLKTIQDDYKVRVLPNGKLDFSRSNITGDASKKNLQAIFNDIRTWDDTTPDGLDTLKQRIQDYYRGADDSRKSDRISTIVSSRIKDKIVSEVPEYKDMVGTYERITNDLQDITKTLSLGKGTQTQTAITKLKSILRDNFEARQDVVKMIEEYTGSNIQAQVAGASLNPMLARGLAGVITGGGVVFGQLANPGFWAGLGLASPRLIGEIAKVVGVSQAKMQSFISKISKNGLRPKNPITPATSVMSNMESSSQKITQKLLPQGKKSPIITPQTLDKARILESKTELSKAKIVNPQKGTKSLDNKGGYINPSAIVDDITKAIKTLTPKNITQLSVQIASKLKVSVSKVQAILKEYVQKYGAELKNKAGDLFDDLADRLGVRAKLLAGENAKFAPTNLEKAKMMDKLGNKADDIWEKTGWEKGTDGKWRFEIDDSKAKIKDINRSDAIKGKGYNITDIIQHNNIFKQYPELKGVKVYFGKGMKSKATTYNYPGDEYPVIKVSFNQLAPGKSQELKSTLLHEIQHTIQGQEGFAKGGTDNIGFDTYKKLAGETEARNVQTRLLNPTKLRPELTEDIPRNKQIIRKDGGTAMSLKIDAPKELIENLDIEKYKSISNELQDELNKKFVSKLKGKEKEYNSLFKSVLDELSYEVEIYKQGIKNKLTPTEIHAIYYGYTNPTLNRFSDINLGLRRGNVLDERSKIISDIIPKAIDKLPIYKGYSYRGINGYGKTRKLIEEMKPGDTFTDKGFLSSSKSLEEAQNFSLKGGIIMKIKGMNGRDISSISYVGEELEILFKPNSKFRFLGKNQKGEYLFEEI